MDQETEHHYISAWTRVLQGCLGWPEPKVREWIATFLGSFPPEGKFWLFHQPPMWWIAKFFVPDDLRRRIRDIEYGTLLNELVQALEAGDDYRDYTDTTELARASVRVTAVLDRYRKRGT